MSKKKSNKGNVILWKVMLDGKFDSYHHTEKAAFKHASNVCESLAYQDDPWFPKVDIVPMTIDDFEEN